MSAFACAALSASSQVFSYFGLERRHHRPRAVACSSPLMRPSAARTTRPMALMPLASQKKLLRLSTFDVQLYSMKVALATVVFSLNRALHCRVEMWCRNMDRVRKDVFRGNASIVVLTRNATNHCPFRTDAIGFDPGLGELATAFASAHRTNQRMSIHFTFHRNLFFKWQIFALDFDRVVYTDTDVDPYFAASYSRLDFTKAFHHVARMSGATMYGHPDHASPINTGLLVVTPNATLYEQGKDVVRRNRFNTTHGFDLLGAPQDTMLINEHTRHTVCVRENTWQFVGGDSDQGLFAHMMYVRKELTVLTPQHMDANHFWGWFKPFSQPPCERYLAHVRRSLPGEHACLALMTRNIVSRCFWNHRTRFL